MAAASDNTPAAADLPTLPHSLVHEICHYLWPADVARLADTCRSLGAKNEEEAAGPDGVGAAFRSALLIEHGLRIFRPTHALPPEITFELICHRLPRLKGLRVLDLSGARAAPGALREMGRLAAEEGAFKSLRVLSFYDHGLGRAGAEELAAALARGGFRDSLESLYVRADRPFEDGGGDHQPALFRALEEGACQAPLRALCLAQTGLDDWAAEHLGRALANPHLKRLKKLDLHRNVVGDEGARAIALGLVEGGGMPCLDEMYLGFNLMGDDGAQALAQALPAMPALRELDLATNTIGDHGAVALAQRLVRPPDGSAVLRPLALETMDLRANRVTERGAERLAAVLTAGPLLCAPRLAALYLDDNRAVRSAAGKAALQGMQAGTGIAWAYADVW